MDSSAPPPTREGAALPRLDLSAIVNSQPKNRKSNNNKYMNIYKALYLSMVRMRRRDNASIGPVSHCEWSA